MSLEHTRVDRQVRFGSYVAVRHIATGGMAEIYLARDERATPGGKPSLYVVKQLLPSLAHERRYHNMFIDEARIAGRLRHPNIVQVLDTGDVEDGCYFSMEYLHGHALPAIHRQLVRRGRGLPVKHSLNIGIQLCAALDYAHDLRGEDGQPLGIVHRDISHSNVHVTFDGTVKLLDFGIARASHRIEQTRVGVLKGKLRYMSPEQVFGCTVDRRSDLFSLSILLWELTTGRQLFDQTTDLDVLRAIGDAAVPLPSSIRPGYPRRLEEVVMKGLQREPSARYQSAGEMSAALIGAAASMGADTTPAALSGFLLELFTGDASPDEDPPEPDIVVEMPTEADVVAVDDAGERAAVNASSTGETTAWVVLALAIAVALGVGLFIAADFVWRHGGWS